MAEKTKGELFEQAYLNVLKNRRIAELVYGELADPYGEVKPYLLDLVTAAEPPAGKRPVVCYFPGSGFRQLARRRLCRNEDAPTIAESFIRAGFAYVGVDYPLWHNKEDYRRDKAERTPAGGNPGFTVTAYAADAFRRVRAYLRAHAEQYGLDMERIVYFGTSAGAITGLFTLAAEPEAASVFVDMCGAYETNPVLPDSFPPVYCMHGDQDTTVPYAWQLDLQKRLDASKIPHRFIVAEGCGHDITEAMNRRMDEILRFCTEHLSK